MEIGQLHIPTNLSVEQSYNVQQSVRRKFVAVLDTETDIVNLVTQLQMMTSWKKIPLCLKQ